MSRKTKGPALQAGRALKQERQAAEPDFAKLAAPYKGMFKGPIDLSACNRREKQSMQTDSSVVHTTIPTESVGRRKRRPYNGG